MLIGHIVWFDPLAVDSSSASVNKYLAARTISLEQSILILRRITVVYMLGTIDFIVFHSRRGRGH
jgi:hypothetical protein